MTHDTRDARPFLIVEDDASLRRVLSRNLLARGFAVVEAPTVSAAIAAIERATPELVLLDVELPDGTGWDVLRVARGRGVELRSVILSAAQARPERIAEFTPLATLRKPFPLESVLRLV